MSDEMTQYPPDLRSRYEKVSEALLARGFEIMKATSIEVPGIYRYYWGKDVITIIIDCVGNRVIKIKLLTRPGCLCGAWLRINSVFKFLEKHGWGG